MKFISYFLQENAHKKFQIYPSFTFFLQIFSKPPKNVCYFKIYQVVLINKSAYKELKQQELNDSIYFRNYKRSNKGIKNRARFQGLQIEAKGITNRGSLKDFKSKQIHYKSCQRDIKSGKRLQTRTGITNWCRAKVTRAFCILNSNGID